MEFKQLQISGLHGTARDRRVNYKVHNATRRKAIATVDGGVANFALWTTLLSKTKSGMHRI
jgi:hypothetical protein